MLRIRAAQLSREIRTRINRRRSIFRGPSSMEARDISVREREALRDEVSWSPSSLFPERGISFFDRAQI